MAAAQAVHIFFPSLTLLKRATSKPDDPDRDRWDIDIAKEAALRQRPFGMLFVTVVVSIIAVYGILGNNYIHDFCDANYGSMTGANRIRAMSHDLMWEDYPIFFYTVFSAGWLALWHLCVSASRCLRPGSLRSLFTLENVALLIFVVAEYTGHVLWHLYTERTHGRDWVYSFMYLSFEALYLFNANLLLAVTAAYQAAPAKRSRLYEFAHWLVWLIHCFYTLSFIATFLQCAGFSGRLYAARLGPAGGMTLLSLCHFSDTHRCIMVMGVLLGVHVSESPHDPPNIMHFIEVLKRPIYSVCAVVFVSVAFGLTLLLEFTARPAGEAAYEEFGLSWLMVVLYAILAFCAGRTYMSDTYKDTDPSWEAILILLAATGSMYHYLHLDESEGSFGNLQTCGFSVMVIFSADVFSSRVKCSGYVALVPLFIALTMLVDCTIVEFADLVAAEPIDPHSNTMDPGISNDHPAPHHLRRLNHEPDTAAHGGSHGSMMHLADFMLNEFALVSVIGWLVYFLEEFEGSGHGASLDHHHQHDHGHAHAEVTTEEAETSVEAWRARRKTQTVNLRVTQHARRTVVMTASRTTRSRVPTFHADEGVELQAAKSHVTFEADV